MYKSKLPGSYFCLFPPWAVPSFQTFQVIYLLKHFSMHIKPSHTPHSTSLSPSCLPSSMQTAEKCHKARLDRRLRLAGVKMLMHREEMRDELWVCRTSSYHDFKRWSLRTLFSAVDWHKWTETGQDARPQACKLLPFSIESLQSFSALKWKWDYAAFHKMWRHLSFKST